MAKPKLSWWVVPSIVTASIAMLGGLGTCAVKYATFESLPSKVEAAQQKNVEQDQTLNKLTGIQETWQKIYQQQQQQAPNQSYRPQAPSVWLESDLVDGRQVCTDGQERWWWNAESGC